MVWQLRKSDIPILSLGAKVLACGGGGDTKTIEALLKSIMREDDFISVKTISDLENEWVVVAGTMGSPILFNEAIPSGQEGIQALKIYETITQKNVGALISGEIGGVNALVPLVIAIQTDLPVIDGDGMGRAFPELIMTTFHLSNIPLSPMVLHAHDSNRVIYDSESNSFNSELAKEFIQKNGGHAHFIGYGSKGREMKIAMIPGTLNLIFRLGTVLYEESHLSNKIQDITNVFENSIYGKPQMIICGVVSEVQRWFENETMVGKFIIEGRSSFSNRRIEIEFKNEFISIKEDQYICTTPDLILVLNDENLFPYSVPEIQQGLSVFIFGVPSPNVLRTKDMLNVVGPESFGLSCTYKPFEGGDRS
ncbi:DUF917 domain-containing protein [Bacillus sp. JJ1532]|uniref:DUF917 domain-containing protein n=1 Tax=Bacillus sp. JJ1532 TaxID=3122958 RepID=UPI002FFED6F3